MPEKPADMTTIAMGDGLTVLTPFAKVLASTNDQAIQKAPMTA